MAVRGNPAQVPRITDCTKVTKVTRDFSDILKVPGLTEQFIKST